jgi:hypothetical protein
MRFFSPIFLRTIELNYIKHALKNWASPIHTPVCYRGIVKFVPIRVENLNVSTKIFEANYMGCQLPYLEFDSLRDSNLGYSFKEDGTYEPTTKADRYFAIYEGHGIENIELPDIVQNSDILLTSQMYKRYRGVFNLSTVEYLS